jgi:hypothetical protein
MSNFIDRRKFVTRTALSAAGLLVSEQIMGIPGSGSSENTIEFGKPCLILQSDEGCDEIPET